MLVVVLGQSDAGKSTFCKQFQLMHAPHIFEDELPLWRPIIYLNIIRAVRAIFDDIELASVVPTSDVAQELAELRLQLLPLFAVEEALVSEFNGGFAVPRTRRPTAYLPTGKAPLALPLVGSRSAAGGAPTDASSLSTASTSDHTAEQLASRTITFTHSAIAQLWRHPYVQKLSRLGQLQLEESASYFLKNVFRISQIDYFPTSEDVLHTRLETLGIIEHSIYGHPTRDSFRCNWMLYDVSGTARGRRHAWAPFFDAANAIVFVAPISAFDQYTDEGQCVPGQYTNRIEHSLRLFEAVVANPLLANANFVLMLNKVDVLKQKLASGVHVAKYLTSYGNRPNTYWDVADYFRAHFVKAYEKRHMHAKTKPCFKFFTTLTDVQQTQQMILNLGETIMRNYVQSCPVL
ncbi:P-loop containing nucleoside triphosphate hydrolase protein [Fistulina hepatica ATCC 64428]|uniref:p-loop containing nucleoside triphosphate hydrolase protein n=1 Tax=Fistulina hepatica ATCC 64428 TaxID=1128425 RepID=A0A0D7ARJ1_9AGAR|nr:P-loop containing nucleoside triphosphate hydrolase protein [Fistulina hepatica ATCC 64428]